MKQNSKKEDKKKFLSDSGSVSERMRCGGKKHRN